MASFLLVIKRLEQTGCTNARETGVFLPTLTKKIKRFQHRPDVTFTFVIGAGLGSTGSVLDLDGDVTQGLGRVGPLFGRLLGERHVVAVAVVRLEEERRAAALQLALRDDRDPVAQHVRLVHVVRGQQHRATCGWRQTTPRNYVFNVTSVGQRKYVYDVISIGQRSSPWTWNSVKVESKFHLECKLHLPSAQLLLRQMHLTNVSESIEAKYLVSWLSLDV